MNHGISGKSSLIYRVVNKPLFVSYNIKDKGRIYSSIGLTASHVDVSLVENDELNIEAFKKWQPEWKDAEFVLENGKFICGSQVRKCLNHYTM